MIIIMDLSFLNSVDFHMASRRKDQVKDHLRNIKKLFLLCYLTPSIP